MCGLLLIIAVSCTCKLIAMRQVEDSETLSRSHVTSHISDDQLLQLEPDSFFCYREPPPSYAAAVGSAPTVAFDSGDRRRMRRMRRHRRPPLSPPPPVSPHPASHSVTNVNLTSGGQNQRAGLFSLVGGGMSQSQQSTHEQHALPEGKASDDETKSQSDAAGDATRHSDPATGSLVTIELDSIAPVHPVALYDCDQEPLLHSPS